MSKLIPNTPLGSLCSGELFFKLCTDKETLAYQYNNGKFSARWHFFMDENGNVTHKGIDSDIPRAFDFNGLLTIMNSPNWNCVVFDNYWFARAYELGLKRGKVLLDKPEDNK